MSYGNKTKKRYLSYLFKKLEYRFSVETTKTENTSFPFKTALSEANVNRNRIVTTKWTYHKKWSFDSNYLIFWKICFSFRTSQKELIWCTNDPDFLHIQIFRTHWSLTLGYFLPVSILKVFFIYFLNFRRNFLKRL